LGWTLQVTKESNSRSVRNFPLQANGAEMLRLACCYATEAGIQVSAPVHDALLIEAPAENIEEAVRGGMRGMQRASEEVLGGFSLRTEAKIVRHPDRYMDPRGEEMWKTVFAMLDEKDTNGDDRCPQATEGCTGATDVSYILGSRVKSPIVFEKVSSPG